MASWTESASTTTGFPVVTSYGTRTAHVALSVPSPSTGADSAVADHSRSADGESFVVPTDAHRDDLNAAGHRPTEFDRLAS